MGNNYLDGKCFINGKLLLLMVNNYINGKYLY